MKIRHAMTWALCALLLAGCSTPRQNRSLQAASSIASLNKLLDKGVVQTDRLIKSTESLSTVNASGLREAYERFSKDARGLRAVAADVRSHAAAMKKRSQTYLVQWEKEIGKIGDRELKQMSRERQALLEQEYQKITAPMAELGQVYTACEASLADIEKFLGNDLTGSGRKMAMPYLDKLAKETLAVKAATRATQDALAHLEQMLKPR